MAIALAQGAVRRGWEGVTWVPGPGPAADALVREGLAHRVIEIDVLTPDGLPRLLTCARLFAGMIRQRRAVMHVHDGWMWGQVRPALLRTGVPTIVHVNIEPDNEEIAWLLKLPPAHVVTCAHYVARKVQAGAEQLGISIPVTAVPNSIDVVRFQPGDRQAARRKLGFADQGTLVMLILANLAPHKGQATVLRALRRLRDRGISAECWIVGEDRGQHGDSLGTLRALASELGVTEHARFLGYRSDAPELLQAADVFVLPTTIEGLPLSLLEAQATGTPVVSSNIPGVLEVVEDGKTGFIVPPDDFAGYADRVALLARDEASRQRLTQAALDRVRREHSWTVFEDRMFDVYARMAGEKRAS
jgi:glycosyltransferase involved in cell wall biosynthesis